MVWSIRMRLHDFFAIKNMLGLINTRPKYVEYLLSGAFKEDFEL